MLPIGKPLLILGAIVAALLLVQTIASPYQEQLAEARESAVVHGEQTQAAAEAVEAAQARSERAIAKKEEAIDAAQQTSDFDDAAPSSLVVFTQRLLGNG